MQADRSAGRHDEDVNPLHTRRAGPDDVDVLLETVRRGFGSYVEFAPPGWVPPPMDAQERARTAEYLGEPDTWALLALDGERPVGHISVIPARERTPESPRNDWREWPLIPGLAHLWQLFVRPPWWGTGAAALLHAAAVEEMSARGFGGARLYTPALHARARRFYERRGWQAVDEAASAELGLALVEYRLEL